MGDYNTNAIGQSMEFKINLKLFMACLLMSTVTLNKLLGIICKFDTNFLFNSRL